MALGVESANAKLDVQNEILMTMHDKLDKIFRKLDTTREKDILSFIEKKGGPKACVENEQLLHELVDKSGEGIAGVLGQQSDETWVKAKDRLQTALRKELAEDVGQALKTNFAEFQKKLTIQSRQLDSLAEDYLKNTQSILTAMNSGAHDRISDVVSCDVSFHSRADSLQGHKGGLDRYGT